MSCLKRNSLTAPYSLLISDTVLRALLSSKEQLLTDYAEPLLHPGSGASTEGGGILEYHITELVCHHNDGCDSDC